MARVERMPAVELPPRDSDLHLTNEQFLQLSLFAQLGRKPNLEKFPGTMVVRRYAKGEVICRQGEPGWTAFWILTTDDALTVRQAQMLACTSSAERRALEAEVERLRQRAEQLRGLPADHEKRTAARVYLSVAQTVLGRAPRAAAAPAGPVKNVLEKTMYIPIDGPVTMNYDSLWQPLREGELFGEMSCMYRSPRSATIVARRDCYVIEMLRNILDQIVKDPKYKAQADEIYKKRVLELHLRKLSLFKDLDDLEYREIRDSVELLSVEPGELICDEHERSDSLYIVRSGLVKVMKSVSALLSVDQVKSWAELWAALRQGEAKEAPATRARLWQMLPEPVRALVRRAAPDSLSPVERQDVVYALNDLISTPKLIDVKEFQEAVSSPLLREMAAELLARRQDLLKKKQDWAPPDNRRYNRLLLERLLPGALEPRSARPGPEWILSYISRGDYFGEIGLMEGKPRSATCMAYGHPNDLGVVELVRLPGLVFENLVRSSQRLRQHVAAEIKSRKKQMKQQATSGMADENRQVSTSPRFKELGLIQGQKLMLIDLDRCTRCDECVKACVATHTDGNSRLFLDGPRFGKYLVPTTCRSCLDPVCMIGCPVGSIHRGSNRQIVIEDWCIGCGLCSDNCPYGSIQMHDLGVLPERERGWRYLPAGMVSGERWLKPGYADSGWLVGVAPFRLDRELHAELLRRTPRGAAAGDAINFRYELNLSRAQVRPDSQFRIELTSLSPSVRLWLNGRELTSDDKPKRDGRREYSVPPKAKAGGPPPMLLRELMGPGANVIAVQVAPTAKPEELLLQVRLDEIRRPDLPVDVDEKAAAEITQKQVTEVAVVCDLCSTLSRREPACVQACPHDAAMRVDARSEFPVG
jgi:CRP-like cAMP-binding protein